MAPTVKIQQSEEQTSNNPTVLPSPQESTTATTIQTHPPSQQNTNVTLQSMIQQTNAATQPTANTNPSTKPTKSANASTKLARLLFLPVILNDKPVNAYIDTGADVNIIRPEAVPSGTCYITDNTELVDGFGYRCALRHACYLDIEISGRKYKLKFFVCKDYHIMMTLGFYWMEEYKVILDIVSATVTFDGKMKKLTEMTTIGLFFTYYGQPNCDLWFPERPNFFKAYFKKIQEEGKSVDKNEYEILNTSIVELGLGLLLRKGFFIVYEANKRPRLYVPKKLRARISNIFHTTLNDEHYSSDVTLKLISEHYYWPEMQNEIYDSVEKCAVCLEKKNRSEDVVMKKPGNLGDAAKCDSNEIDTSLSISDTKLDLIKSENCMVQLIESQSCVSTNKASSNAQESIINALNDALESTTVEETVMNKKKELA